MRANSNMQSIAKKQLDKFFLISVFDADKLPPDV